MKVIVVSKRHGKTRSFTISGWARALLSICVVGIPLSAMIMSAIHLTSNNSSSILTPEFTTLWGQAIGDQERQLEDATQHTEQTLSALTLRVAELQARLVRLDALGERLTQMAKLDSGEFDFSSMPALGGPESLESGGITDGSFVAPDVSVVLNRLGEQIEDRKLQLGTLEALLSERQLQRDVFIAGRPIKKGWMSSRYGRRADPFTGRVAFHEGVDFAGKTGADIIAVASGVVTWSAERYGYGNLVEVNHGNGFVTRYAHCKENLVALGEVIKKGQVIALMGSSGRSTGPHVHFEVYKNGRVVDPASYIHRTHL